MFCRKKRGVTLSMCGRTWLRLRTLHISTNFVYSAALNTSHFSFLPICSRPAAQLFAAIARSSLLAKKLYTYTHMVTFRHIERRRSTLSILEQTHKRATDPICNNREHVLVTRFYRITYIYAIQKRRGACAFG